MKKIILIIVLGSLFVSGCGSSKKTIVEEKNVNEDEIKIIQNDKKGVKEEYTSRDLDILKYIAKYKTIAQREMREYGIPASITIAQGILESQAGKSELATRANNHFGVKCHNDWTGQRYLYDDDEMQECFRKYENPERSYVDHSKFLAHRKRYAFLFRLPKTDYEAWAKGLKKAGYATDPSYPDKLIYLINKYRLNELDKQVLEGMSIKVNETADNNQKQDKKFIYEVKSGETIFTISNKFNIPVKKIQQINNLNDFDIYEGQILVLTLGDESNLTEQKQNNLQTEQIEAENKNENTIDANTVTQDPNLKKYIVKEGQTLFSIAKENNIKVEDLLSANHFDKSTEIKVGQMILVPIKNETNEIKQEVQEEVNNDEQKESKAVYHIVKQGETLYRIHVNYGVSVETLRKLNNLKGNYIKVGQRLRVK